MVSGIYIGGELARQTDLLRGRHVMHERNTDKWYGVETRMLNQSVRRHIRRFPDDLMFQLRPEEFAAWKSQIVISMADVMSWRIAPVVFAELVIGILSGAFYCQVAIDIHIFIMRAFQRMKAPFLSHRKLLDKLQKLEKSVEDLYGSDTTRKEMLLALSLQLERFFEQGKRITRKGYRVRISGKDVCDYSRGKWRSLQPTDHKKKPLRREAENFHLITFLAEEALLSIT